jgi:hypothetical protein
MTGLPVLDGTGEVEVPEDLSRDQISAFCLALSTQMTGLPLLDGTGEGSLVEVPEDLPRDRILAFCLALVAVRVVDSSPIQWAIQETIQIAESHESSNRG